jgi:hypothetical protein
MDLHSKFSLSFSLSFASLLKKCGHGLLLCRERKLRRKDSGVNRLTSATNKLIQGKFSRGENESKVYGDRTISSKVEILLGWDLHTKISFGRVVHRTRICGLIVCIA